MNITQLRNATLIIATGDYRILVDPMLAPKGAIPPLKYATRSRRRNPLVDLPENTNALLATVTHALITHCQKGHFDHLDRAGTQWLRTHNIPVFGMQEDAGFLDKKGLNVRPLKPGCRQPLLAGHVTPIPCQHGTGLVGSFMAHGHGYVLEFPDEPRLYLAGDTILTDEVAQCIQQHQPDICVVPAGGAQFDIGGEVIMGVEDVASVVGLSTGTVVANHLESLDHCPTTREQLRILREQPGIGSRLLIPEDGQEMTWPKLPCNEAPGAVETN